MASKLLEALGTGLVSETAAMRIAGILRNRILKGELVPGQRLKMEEIAATMNMSTMPVREAFQLLEGEGALDIFPHRGAVVRSIDAEFIIDIYDMRGAINGMLVERSIRRSTDAFIPDLRRLNEEYARAAGTGDRALVINADARLHGRIADQARNREAARVLSHGVLMTQAIRRRFGYSPEFLKRAMADHEAIIAAIERRDAMAAGKLQRLHCDAARDDLLAMLAEHLENPSQKEECHD